MANLEIPHSLLGTMVDPTALLMAEQQRILAQLRAEQANKRQDATIAGNAYTQAAGQPEPALPVAPAATEQFFGDIASIISRRPEFGQRAQQSLAEQKQRLMRNRATNLQAMRDRWEKMADAADQLDPVQALEARTQLDKIDKQLEGLMKQQETLAQQDFQRGRDKTLHGYTLEEIKARGEQDVRAASVRASGANGGDDGYGGVDQATLEFYASGLEEGRFQNGISAVPVGKNGLIRNAVAKYMQNNNRVITPPKVREALNELSAAEQVVSELKGLSEQVNTAGPGMERFWVGAQNIGGAILQTNKPAGMQEAVRKAMTGNLTRAVSAERGVLTNQDREFAMSLIPSLTDSGDFAKEKIATLERFIASKKTRATKYFTSPASVLLGGKEAQTKAPDHVTMIGPNGQKKIVRVGSADYYEAYRRGGREE